MSKILITGSGGLIGSEAALYFIDQGYGVIGIDNDMRSYFFGEGASTAENQNHLRDQFSNFTPLSIDVSDFDAMERVFDEYRQDIRAVIHTAAQPSHDWAAREPLTDFRVNCKATVQLLELTRRFCRDSAFVFLSTNKVYGDNPNAFPFTEKPYRWELSYDHPYAEHGIREDLSLDQCTHSLFGASKASADLYVQEYGRYFDMNTVCFRAGCLTGKHHAGSKLHGFLAFLTHCAVSRKSYEIIGYKGKQVRDNLHSYDLCKAMDLYIRNPQKGAVFNIGGGRENSCSVLEAIQQLEDITGQKMKVTYSDTTRTGDHIWWISDTRRFEKDYPEWKKKMSLNSILSELLVHHEARL
jgi:CDP-paratose 2-epimerase